MGSAYHQRNRLFRQPPPAAPPAQIVHPGHITSYRSGTMAVAVPPPVRNSVFKQPGDRARFSRMDDKDAHTRGPYNEINVGPSISKRPATRLEAVEGISMLIKPYHVK